ncbi:MAG TPA: L-glutamate gamma-semialdehyde dehydrogenase [Longimicrobiaceae bacterium]|jgi:1-pyrroline-5-carboxylate dehydrogenase|nr:L-glutamate gamma-semialdehyde dehydrogenase [Longimicrobiaceae bacterium]
MSSSISRVPAPYNEPVLGYAPGSPERAELKATLARMAGEQIEIPVIVGGKEIRTGNTETVVMPHDHGHVLATWHKAGDAEIRAAIDSSLAAQRDWARWPWEERAAVLLRAAELLATRWRPIMNAATMLGQSKTAHQAEIDAACEMIDFFRFNAHFAQQLYSEQPISSPGVWNRSDHRPLEGFVYAVTPFNFTSIAGNLPTAPALLGNVAIWKPAATAVYSGWHIMKLLEEAGLPPGVINFVPGDPGRISELLLNSRDLAGVHFTGSTAVFQSIWKTVGNRIDTYRSYPRLVGETGGKDFIVAHASADAEALATAIVRGGYEYQGQKCSAASRIYVPDSIWPRVKELTLGMMEKIKVGDPADFRNFMGAVIDRKAYDKITGYIKHAEKADGVEIIAGGKYDDSKGYFIDPTLVQAQDSAYQLMCEEVFGPVVSLHVYPEAKWAETLRIVDETTPYSLTGAVFANDRAAVAEADRELRNAAGNFYINDKPTGAVVGQQPFGGARASGTNDKAGSILNLIRWISPRTIKETFSPPRAFEYPFMNEK